MIGIAVSCLLMDRLATMARSSNLNVIVLAQYPPATWRDAEFGRNERKVGGTILGCARRAGLATLDAYDETRKAAARDGVAPFYINGHMNDLGNALTAKIIAGRLRSPP